MHQDVRTNLCNISEAVFRHILGGTESIELVVQKFVGLFRIPLQEEVALIVRKRPPVPSYFEGTFQIYLNKMVYSHGLEEE